MGDLDVNVNHPLVGFHVASSLWQDRRMADARRSSPEPPQGGPEIVHTPGMAEDMMRELAPLLAEDGIDLDDPGSIPDQETLQRALDRAVERRNMALFAPVGDARSLALTVLRLFAEAVADNQTALAGAVLATAVPESPDDSRATVAGTIGVGLDLLDTILSGQGDGVPQGLAARTRLPKGHWVGERAARDILQLAQRGRAFDALGALIVKHGSHAVQSGTALALAAGVQTWADQVTPDVFR